VTAADRKVRAQLAWLVVVCLLVWLSQMVGA
jgi:hypothetical protein